MRRLFRWLGILGVVLLFATAAAAALPRYGIELLGPHTVKKSQAQLDPALRKAIDESIDESPDATVDEALSHALAVSDKLLHFGLSHETKLSFSVAEGEREGNCIEYAHLFAKVFERMAAKMQPKDQAKEPPKDGAKVAAKEKAAEGTRDKGRGKAAEKAQEKKPGVRVFVVHSDKAQVFGRDLPWRGWTDHDWVLIEAPSVDGEGKPRRWFVDPTMHDAGFGWDVSANVRGDVVLPK